MKAAATPARLNVILFSGGRGTASISDALVQHPQISLTILVNAYDDGLSTGRLRRFIPGMLGPSDVRKNLSRLIGSADSADQAMQFLLEYRFPAQTDYASGAACLDDFSSFRSCVRIPELDAAWRSLSLSQAEESARYLRAFSDYMEQRKQQGDAFDFGDCSLGNLLFAGCFLSSERNFNRTIDRMALLCRARARVLNVTEGENLVLVGVKDDGTFLKDEAEIVSPQNASRISEIFLLDDYLTQAESVEQLRRRSRTPGLGAAARQALADADIIIYGPGTQHSSLFPSYLTRDLAEVVAGNSEAEKIFIANIYKDHEIQSETATTLTAKLLNYLSRKGEVPVQWEQCVTRFFFHSSARPGDHQNSDYIEFKRQDFPYPLDRVTLVDWEVSSGTHRGGRVVDELVAIVNARLQQKLKPFRSLVSIVVPGLNEHRTVRRVLHDLLLLDFQKLGLGKEILFVDGGSTDGTFEAAQSEREVRCFQLEGVQGRGSALRLGVEKASGDVIVFFPSDAEYDPRDLEAIVLAIVRNDFPVVFGSRMIKCVNLTERIHEIYKGNWFGYWVSKYGGMAISIVSLFLYNRFISDAFTSIKAFDARLLKSLSLESKGVDLETEIIAKLALRRAFILELPVEFTPRRKVDGKKTTVFDGIRALMALFKYRIIPHARPIHRHSGL